MFDADQILFDHVWRTLPDSISGRRRILNALQCKLTEQHPAWVTVSAMLNALEVVDQLQSQLPFSQEIKA